MPPGTYKLWLASWYDSDEIEDEDDEDPSDEEEQSNEQNSQGSGSGDLDDDDSENDDDDNDDKDDDTDKQSEEKDAKKKVGKRKSTGKFTHKKNTKMQHSRKTKSGTRILDSHKTKKQRVKRRAVPTKVHSKRAHHLAHREKLRKSKRNHVRKAQDEQRSKETLETVSTSTTPQITTEETSDEDKETAQQVYANYISEVARVIAKARGTGVSEEHINKDIKDMIKFQVELAKVSVMLLHYIVRL